MLIRLLGPVEVETGDGRPALGGPRQRALLADLALHAGRTVLTAQLVDDLWGESPPASARHTVEAYVSRLRRALEEPGAESVLLTRGPGYLLQVQPDQVDALHFRQLVEEARAAGEDDRKAADLLSAAMSLWRGPALADIRSASFASTAATQWENSRLDALETLFDLQIRLGRDGEILSDLERAIGSHPYRERFHGQLMLALYRCGRQGEALGAFQQARRLLADDLGIQPGEHLRRLETAILQQSPELMRVSAVAQPAGTAASAHRGREASEEQIPQGAAANERRRRRTPRARALVASGAALLTLTVALATLLTVLAPAHVAIATVAVNELTAGQRQVSRSVALPSEPESVATGAGSVWVTSADARALYRINPRSGSRQTIAVGAGADALAVTDSDVWVANSLAGTVSRVSTATDRVVATVPAGVRPSGIAVGGGLVWVADESSSTVIAIDAVTGLARFAEPLGFAPHAIAFGDDSAWLADPDGDTVTRVGSGGAPVVQISAGVAPAAVAFGSGSLWVANGLDSTVSRIDPATDAVSATIAVGDAPDALAVSGSSVWVANRLSATLSRIDARTDVVAQPVGLRGGPVGLGVLNGRVWATTGQIASPLRTGGSIRVVTAGVVESIDPAMAFPDEQAQLSQGTYDTLVTPQRLGGDLGPRLVPDLALAMPAVTGAGTVYAFRLRPGLRYSDGTFVRPEDFRHAIERVNDLNGTAAGMLSGIIDIETSDTADSITFHLVAADPEFLQKLALPFAAPVPLSVPDRDVGDHPVPSTGPYEMISYTDEQLVLVRNPYFHEWSAAAEPAGAPDRIIWSYNETFSDEVKDILDGKADWTTDDVAGLTVVRAQHPSQFHASPGPNVAWAAFNTTVAPFNDVRVRRAFSLAADRRRLVTEMGGPGLAIPTCQFLPSGYPGYQAYCPYTKDPTSSGAWVGPDLAAAKKLVAESGTRGMKVKVWSTLIDTAIGRFMVSTLDELGYKASVVAPSDDVFAEQVNDSRLKAQAADGDWTFDYPSPSDLFDQFWPCSASRPADPADTRNGSFFCDRTVDRLITAADQEQASDPVRAVADWAAADKRLVDDAPWAPLVTTDTVNFLSTRVGNYRYSAATGMLLDQLTVLR
jgi:YVTN family beta-propeller protein